MRYPKGVEENVRFRWRLVEECLRDAELARTVREIAKRDILFYFNVFLWTYDPRTTQKVVPFVTWDFQDEYILAVDRAIEGAVIGGGRQDVFTDKSRDMGVTWMVLGVFHHRWLFKGGEEFRVGSRKEDYVDKPGDMDSLFEKFRLFNGYLPKFMLPVGFDAKKDQPFMKILNRENSSALIGEATNRDFARGGRKKAVLFDEFQAWEMADLAWRSATDSTLCKIAVGTPEGLGNKFGELKRSGEVRHKFNLMWWLHPHKAVTSEGHLDLVRSGGVVDKVNGYKVGLNKDQSKSPAGCYVDQNGKIRSEWYDLECMGRDRVDIAQNLDCDYLSTGQPVFDTLICEQKKYESVPAKWVGELNWVVRPMFDSYGNVLNADELSVEFVDNLNGRIYVWEKPVEGWDDGYVIGADCAEGLEQGDYNSAVVDRMFPVMGENWEKFRPVTVCEIHGHQKTFEYAEDLVKLAVWYGYAWLAIERNNQGLAVINEAFKLYRKLYHDDIATKGYPEKKDRIGFTTTSYTKPIVVKNLSKGISQGLFVDPREGFWGECLTFVNNDGRMEAQGKSEGQKCFDDRVMSKAITLWIGTQLPGPVRVREKEEEKRWMQKRKDEKKSLIGWVV